MRNISDEEIIKEIAEIERRIVALRIAVQQRSLGGSDEEVQNEPVVSEGPDEVGSTPPPPDDREWKVGDLVRAKNRVEKGDKEGRIVKIYPASGFIAYKKGNNPFKKETRRLRKNLEKIERYSA